MRFRQRSCRRARGSRPSCRPARPTTRSATRVAPPSDPRGKTHSRSVTLSLDEHLHAELRTTDAVSRRAARRPTRRSRATPALRRSRSPSRSSRGSSATPSTRGSSCCATAGRTSGGRSRLGGPHEPRRVPGRLERRRRREARTCLSPRARASSSTSTARSAAGERLELVVAGAALGKRRLEPVTVGARRGSRARGARPTTAGRRADAPVKILLFPLAMYGGVAARLARRRAPRVVRAPRAPSRA